MNDHRQFQSLMIDAYYNELNEKETKWFAEHLETCSNCKLEYSNLVKTLFLAMQNRPSAITGNNNLDDFWSKLETKLDSQTDLPGNIVRLPTWSYQVAAAVILIVTGFLVGKIFYDSSSVIEKPVAAVDGNQNTASPENKIPVQTVSLDERTQKYFDKSKVMMMAIANFDVKTDDPFVLNVGYQKRISREMITEAADLKKDLEKSDKKQLKKLVSDLEMILLQIANLESEKDLPGIELIKSSVDRRALLMKINIQEMKGGDIKSVSKGKKETGI